MMIVCGTWRPWRYSPLLTRELMFIAFAIPLPPSTLMDNYLQLLFLHSSPVGLVITRYLETLVVVSIILWAYRLAVLCHLNTPMDNSRTYRVSAHSPLFMCFAKDFKISFDHPKIPSSLLLLKFSLAWIMVNPISFLILLASLVFIILSPLIQYVEDARIPQSNPRIHPAGSDVIWIWAGSWPINALIICASNSIELIHFRSERLLLIPWFGNHKISLH